MHPSNVWESYWRPLDFGCLPRFRPPRVTGLWAEAVNVCGAHYRHNEENERNTGPARHIICWCVLMWSWTKVEKNHNSKCHSEIKAVKSTMPLCPKPTWPTHMLQNIDRSSHLKSDRLRNLEIAGPTINKDTKTWIWTGLLVLSVFLLFHSFWTSFAEKNWQSWLINWQFSLERRSRLGLFGSMAATLKVYTILSSANWGIQYFLHWVHPMQVCWQ